MKSLRMNGGMKSDVRPTCLAGFAIRFIFVQGAVAPLPYAFLLACWLATGCNTPGSSILRAVRTLDNKTGGQKWHLMAGLYAYHSDNDKWPESPEQLAAFIPPDFPFKFDPNRFRELTFQPQPDGKLFVRFVFDLPPPESWSGAITLEPPDPKTP
jgi:hypothetical protein